PTSRCEVRGTCSDVHKIHLRYSRKQSVICKQMRFETGETEEPRIDKTEGNHSGGGRRFGSEEQREFVDEITVCGLFPNRSLVSFCRKQSSTNGEFPAEIF